MKINIFFLNLYISNLTLVYLSDYLSKVNEPNLHLVKVKSISFVMPQNNKLDMAHLVLSREGEFIPLCCSGGILPLLLISAKITK